MKIKELIIEKMVDIGFRREVLDVLLKDIGNEVECFNQFDNIDHVVNLYVANFLYLMGNKLEKI